MNRLTTAASLMQARCWLMFAIGVLTAIPAAARADDASPQASLLHRQTGLELAATASDHFLVLHPEADSRRVMAMLDLLEATRDGFIRMLGGTDAADVAGEADAAAADADPLVWVLFDRRADFDAYAMRVDRVDMSWSQAYYSARTNRVAFLDEGPTPMKLTASDVATPGEAREPQVMPAESNAVDRRLSQMTHEAVHQIAFNCGLQRRGVMYPLWASEGLATNFEADAHGRVGPEYDNAYRRLHFAEATERGSLMAVDKLLAMTRVPVGDDRAVDDAYAHAWAFFRFLHTARREQLSGYYAHMAAGRPGIRRADEMRREFVELFGSLDVLQSEWERYALALGDVNGSNDGADLASADRR